MKYIRLTTHNGAPILVNLDAVQAIVEAATCSYVYYRSSLPNQPDYTKVRETLQQIQALL